MGLSSKIDAQPSFFSQAYHSAYTACYTVGQTALYYGKKSVHVLKKYTKPLFGWFKKAAPRGWAFTKRTARQAGSFFKNEILGALLFITTAPYHLLKAAKRGYKENGFQGAFSLVGNVFKQSKSAVLKHLRVIGSYLCPVAALLVLFAVIGSFQQNDWVVQVSLNGNVLGCIEDETVFFAGEKLMQERIVYDADDEIYNVSPTMQLVREDDEQPVLSADALCNELIRHSGGVFEEGYGLYVDDVFYGATTEGEQLSADIQEILNRHTVGEENATVRFHNDVTVRDGLYLKDTLVDYSELHDLMNSTVDYEATYTVVSGDSPIRIAKKNNISLKTLLSLNPDLERVCLIGQQVIVSEDRPLLCVETVVTEQREVDVDYKSVTIPDKSLAYGKTRVTQKGREGRGIETVEKTYVAGIWTGTNVIDLQVTEQPVTEYVIRGTRMSTTLAASTGDGSMDFEFKWPTRGGYQTCSINGYKGHTGMDIGGLPVGTPIRAAADGVVIKSVKNRTGYGYHIIIDHGNGVQTLYAHCNSLIAKVGDKVEAGDKIATLGATGNAQGKHLHFEIRINGEYKNPVDYIGTYYKW